MAVKKPAVQRPPFEKLYIYVLIVAVAMMGADLIIQYLRPQLLPSGATPAPAPAAAPAPVQRPKNYASITQKNIFNADGKIPPTLAMKNKEGEDETEVEPGIAVRTSLSFLNLLGTIVHFNPRLSIATIHLSNASKTQAYKVGEQIENVALITQIERRKVVFKNLQNNRLEYIDLPEDVQFNLGFAAPKKAPVASRTSQVRRRGDVLQTGENEFSLKRSSFRRYTDNLPSVLQQARVLPEVGPGGGIDGFRFSSVQKGSIFDQLGFQVGDKIKSVNGEPVSSPAQAMEMYQALQSSRSVAIGIERGGQTQEFNYNISD